MKDDNGNLKDALSHVAASTVTRAPVFAARVRPTTDASTRSAATCAT